MSAGVAAAEDVSSSPADKTIHLLLLIPPRKVTPLLASQNQQPDQLQSFWLPEVGGAVLDNSLFWSENIPGPAPSPLPEHVLQQSLRLLRPLLLRVLGFPEPMVFFFHCSLWHVPALALSQAHAFVPIVKQSASQEYLEQVAMLAYRAKMRVRFCVFVHVCFCFCCSCVPLFSFVFVFCVCSFLSLGSCCIP